MKETLDKIYEFTITAFDEYLGIDLSFYIDLSDPAPYLSNKSEF